MGNQDQVNSLPQGNDPEGGIPSSLQEADFNEARSDNTSVPQPAPVQESQITEPANSLTPEVNPGTDTQVNNLGTPVQTSEVSSSIDSINKPQPSNSEIAPENPQNPPQSVDQNQGPQIPPSTPNLSGGGKKAAIIFIAVLLVIIIGLAGVVYASEAGYLNANLDKYYTKIGLQKLWGGLPYDGKQAMAETALKMNGLQSLHASGNISATISEVSGANTPLQSLLEGPNKIALGDNMGRVLGQEDASFETLNALSIEPNTSDSQNVKVGINIDGDLSAEASQASLSLDTSSLTNDLSMFGLSSLASSALRLNIMMIDKKVYLRIPAAGALNGSQNVKWYGVDLKDLTTTTDFKAAIMNKVTAAPDIIKSGQKVGVETVDGIKTNKYELVLDTAQLGQLFTKSYQKDLATYNTTMSVWIGKKDHLIHRFILVTEGSFEGVKTNINLTMDLSKFNEPLNITAPEASQIAESGLLGLSEDFLKIINNSTETGDLEAAEIKARDLQRKSDLASINTGLKVYADQYPGQTAPYPITKDRIKLSSKGNVIEEALTQGSNPIMNSLPIDPVPSKYYYGYKCLDGKTYELTAVMEDTTATGPEITKSGDLLVYTLTNK